VQYFRSMARIVLEPGEEFSHRHDTPSRTILISGTALLETDEETFPLKIGQEVFTEAGTLHHLKAIGLDEVIIECYH
jgi:quercetin dioxygenase-like cupin family protein